LESWYWYIIPVKSNCEKKVVEAITQRLALENIGHLVEEIVIPVEKVEEIRRGKKIVIERKIWPGYILIKAMMHDKLVNSIRSIENVKTYSRGQERFSSLSLEEVERIFSQMREGTNINNSKTVFKIGDYVKVIDGPFESFTGVIENIDEMKGRLKVSVTIFGRSTPVDLEFAQVSKD
jgi:transcriptional antiterminator NusG